MRHAQPLFRPKERKKKKGTSVELNCTWAWHVVRHHSSKAPANSRPIFPSFALHGLQLHKPSLDARLFNNRTAVGIFFPFYRSTCIRYDLCCLCYVDERLQICITHRIEIAFRMLNPSRPALFFFFFSPRTQLRDPSCARPGW